MYLLKIAALYVCCPSTVWGFWYLYWRIQWKWWIEETTRLILTLVSFHEVVDEETEMFLMFLGVSHIANCLFSMFHRIWILVVFWCPVCRIIKHPCSKKHSRFFSLSNSLTHTLKQWKYPACGPTSWRKPSCLMKLIDMQWGMELWSHQWCSPCCFASWIWPNLGFGGYMDPLDESFLKFYKTIGMSRKKKITHFLVEIFIQSLHPIWNYSFTSRNSTSPSTTKTQHGPHLDQSFLSDGILLALPRQLGHHMENVRSIPCQGLQVSVDSIATDTMMRFASFANFQGGSFLFL